MAGDEFFFEYNPEELIYPKDIITKLSDKMFDYIVELNDLKEIEGLSILSINGKQPMRFASKENNFDNLKTVAEVIGSMDPGKYFKDLTDFEYRGLGHLNLDTFEIFLAKIDEQNLFLILTTDPTSALFDKGQKTVDGLREILKKEKKVEQVEDSTDEVADKIETKKPVKKAPAKKKQLSRADLMLQLRGKLDELE